MSRLIDADSLKECYAGTNALDGKADYMSIRKMIDNQPTAYDVEKVVAELEEETDCPNCSMYCADAHICGFDEMRKQAIDLVRKGGVE